MANVQVGAFGASPAGSDSLGMFTLEFPQKHPGDTVRLVITKEGYEVVNDLQVTELTLPSAAESRIVIVLLCKQGNREEMARRYYRLKSIEAIEDSYKRRLKELEEKQLVTAEALVKLKQQREEAIGAAGKTAEELAKVKAGESSEIYRTAMRLFLDGKVEEALETLSGEKLERMAVEAKESKARAEKAIEEAVQAWLLRARLLTVQFRFSEAEKAYREAVETSPQSFDRHRRLDVPEPLDHLGVVVAGPLLGEADPREVAGRQPVGEPLRRVGRVGPGHLVDGRAGGERQRQQGGGRGRSETWAHSTHPPGWTRMGPRAQPACRASQRSRSTPWERASERARAEVGSKPRTTSGSIAASASAYDRCCAASSSDRAAAAATVDRVAVDGALPVSGVLTIGA